MTGLYSRLRLAVAPKAVILLAIAALILLGVMASDVLVFRTTPLANSSPQFTPPYLARTLLIAVAAWAFVTALLGEGWRGTATGSGSAAGLWSKRSAPTAALLANPIGWDATPLRTKRALVLTSLAFTIAVVGLLVISPPLYSLLALEDNPVEVASALLLLLTAGVFIAVALALHRSTAYYRRLYIGLALAAAGAFFFVGMEEISWFQRVLGFQTPESFSANMQNEFNLHNFYSGKFELVYYCGTFLALVALPFFNNQTRLLEAHPVSSLFAPGRHLIFVAALAGAFNYNTWNMAPYQFVFFATLFMLLYILHASSREGAVSPLLATLLAVYVAAQILLIIFGGNSGRIWDATEYRELILPLGFAAYALDVLLRARRLRRPQSV